MTAMVVTTLTATVVAVTMEVATTVTMAVVITVMTMVPVEASTATHPAVTIATVATTVAVVVTTIVMPTPATTQLLPVMRMAAVPMSLVMMIGMLPGKCASAPYPNVVGSGDSDACLPFLPSRSLFVFFFFFSSRDRLFFLCFNEFNAVPHDLGSSSTGDGGASLCCFHQKEFPSVYNSYRQTGAPFVLRPMSTSSRDPVSRSIAGRVLFSFARRLGIWRQHSRKPALTHDVTRLSHGSAALQLRLVVISLVSYSPFMQALRNASIVFDLSTLNSPFSSALPLNYPRSLQDKQKTAVTRLFRHHGRFRVCSTPVPIPFRLRPPST